MKKPLPDTTLTVRIPPPLKDQLKQLAVKESRTVSNLVEVILKKALAV